MESNEYFFFTYYAALVKNLRGVVIYDPDDTEYRDIVKWLTSRFKYRNLGIPPSLFKKDRKFLEAKTNGKPFRILYYPMKEFPILHRLLVELGIDEIFAEAIILSSVYISPLMVLSKKYLGYMSRFTIEEVDACNKIDVRSWKLHLRIADYTILDSYEEMVKLSLLFIDKLKIGDRSGSKEILDKRREFASRDKKRYWRILCVQGNPFLLYIDPLLFISKHFTRKKNLVNKMKRDYAAALAIIPAINLTLVND